MNTYQAKLGRLAANTATRMEYAEEARRRANDGGLFTIDSYINAATRLARHVQEYFPDDFDGPLPDHLAYALDTEITAWERLGNAVALFQEARPNEQEIPAYARNVRRFLTYQIALLDAEHELLTSCLLDQYMHRVDEVRNRLRGVDL